MPAPAKLTLERLYASPALSGPSPRGVKFSPDGKRVTFLKPRASEQNRFDLWQFDVATGKASLLVDSILIDPADAELAEAEKAMRERKRIAGTRGIADYDWGTDDTLLVPAGGDLYLVTLGSSGPEVRRLTETPTFEYDARISPNGTYASFIRDGALYAITLATGAERRLTPLADPDKAISYGVAEFVAQEEMDRYTGYWWSPDERYVAYTRVDESGVDIIPRFDIAADEVTVVNQRYPRAGRPNAVVDLFVLDLKGGAPVEVNWREPEWGLASDQYLARVNWSRASLHLQAINRAQTVILHKSAILERKWQTIETQRETQPHWVNIGELWQTVPGGRYGLTSNEESGFKQLVASTDEGTVTIGGDDWAIDELKFASGQDRRVYFTGFRDTPLERHLYVERLSWTNDEVEKRGAKRLPDTNCIDLTPRSARATPECFTPERITTAGSSWTVTVSPDGQSFVGTSSSPTQPPQTGLYRIDGSLIAWIEENKLDANHPYAPYLDQHTTPEFGTLTAEDGQILHYSIQKPRDFDPLKKYPVIVEVYGGPHAQTVNREWGPLTDVFYNSQDFIVFRLDNRGSWNRGKAFEDVIHLKMGQAEVRDQLLGIDWLKSQPFVDPARIAVQGWSYGGYMTLRMIPAAPPGTFAAAVAGAPVTDWSLYDTFYTERYMGTPEGNPEGYAAGSVLTGLDKLSTPLLLVHGMADDNVTFDNTTRLMAALQELGKTFDVMTYPGQRHGIRGEALQVHLMRTRMAFLMRHMKPETD
ncbi:MAG: S9 family peptidase [Acidobacteria bacterium]|nr:S9 family peptidase [Acidobacteriota bacterium]